jgi:hypothetical protein
MRYISYLSCFIYDLFLLSVVVFYLSEYVLCSFLIRRKGQHLDTKKRML